MEEIIQLKDQFYVLATSSLADQRTRVLKHGDAFGVLSTVEIAPLAGSNGVGNLNLELTYMHSHGLSGVTLVSGTEPFTPVI